MCSLTFFVTFLLVRCQPTGRSELAIRWTGERATGLSIPASYAATIAADSVDKLLTVRLAGNETAIAGTYKQIDTGILFEPLIPFTRGLRYSVWLRNKPLGELLIPDSDKANRPTLLAIYPSMDTLPDNLLKIYLHFSRPMREGQSLKYITVLKNGSDTLNGVFLDLQPELWNAERTRLTLWLDPGRIKRDLQPNRRLGTPLVSGSRYQLVIAADWPDQQGAALGKVTTKNFTATHRDSLSPDPNRWVVAPPVPGSAEPLNVHFGEALDFSLLPETLHIVDDTGNQLAGSWQIGDQETQLAFRPKQIWRTGTYRLRVDGRLEDLAGNNLNRPFDRDITRNDLSQKNTPFKEILFNVR